MATGCEVEFLNDPRSILKFPNFRKAVKTNRKLLVCSLVATLLLAVLAYPSIGIKNPPASARTQEEPKVTGQLVQAQARDGELSKHFRKYDLIEWIRGLSRRKFVAAGDSCEVVSVTSIWRWCLTICALTNITPRSSTPKALPIRCPSPR